MASSSVEVEDLETKWAEFQIADEDDHGLPFDASMGFVEVEDTKLCLVGRLLSKRIHDFGAIKNVMASFMEVSEGHIFQGTGNQ